MLRCFNVLLLCAFVCAKLSKNESGVLTITEDESQLENCNHESSTFLGIDPPSFTKQQSGGLCRYRDEGLYPKSHWDFLAGGECYRFTQDAWHIKKFRIKRNKAIVDNQTYYIPVGVLENGTEFGFLYYNPAWAGIVATSFKTEVFYQKWVSCARNGQICCNELLNEHNIYPTEEYPCPATWDAWSCFMPAKKNSVSELPCPSYSITPKDAPCVLYSEKECFPNGTWNVQTNYSRCATAPVYRKRHNFHVIVLYVSIALSFPAVVIFTSYRNLRILRVSLHRNLLIACILRNIFTILSKELVILDSLDMNTNDVLNSNGVGCRTLAFLNSVAANAIYACMLMDGFYLHKLIVRIFSADPNIYLIYAATAVLSFLPTIIWAILVATQANEYCWMVDGSWYQWIPDGFRIAILSINIILLLDIIRALLCKLRQNVSAQHTKYTYVLISNGLSYDLILRTAFISTLKAMAFLIPLFGVPFILTANRNIVNNDSCKAGDIYYYVSYSIQGLQGVMVAVLFCYWNKEVHMQIKGTIRKIDLQWEAKFGTKNDRRQATYRRETAATYVHNNSVAPQINHARDFPDEDSNRKVKDWLTEYQPAELQGPSPLKPDANPGVNNIELINGSSEQSGLSRRVSKFIDDSNESLRGVSGSTPDGQQDLKQLNDVQGTDGFSNSCPNLSADQNNAGKRF